MENNELKEHFLQLQAQQQQKLLERRKKKEEAKKIKDNKSEAESPSSVFGHMENPFDVFGQTDNLAGIFSHRNNSTLKHGDDSHGKAASYLSEELVDHLNNQIRQLKDENGRLYKLLSEKDFEIRQLKKGKEEVKNGLLEGGLTNEVAASKIIELSKKIRELTAEKEVEKTRFKQLQKKCYDLQLQVQSQAHQADTVSVAESVVSLKKNVDNSKDDDGVDVKALQDRLKQSESRAADFRNQCQSLRQELKIAHKVLQQEIGENVNFQTLLNETSNWRGRAQQVIALQQKVDEYRAQLESLSSENNSVIGEKSNTARRKQEEKHREELKRMEKERREAQENAAVKLKNLETENQNLNEKLDAAKARNKVLSNEIKSLKAQIQTMLKKSKNDTEFIDALLKQQERMKQMLETHSQQQTQQQHLQLQQLQHMSTKSQQDNNVVEQLKVIAAQKESQVKQLELELQQLQLTHMQNHYSSTFHHPSDSRPFTAPVSEAVNVRSQQSHLTQSSLNNARSQSASRVLSRPASVSDAMEANLNQQELMALRYQLQEMEVMSRAVEVEKDKMTELVQVLQARLAEETLKRTEAVTETQTLKRQMVELEKKLARQSLLGSSRKQQTSQVVSSARSATKEDNSDVSGVDNSQVLSRLDLRTQEAESLKAALQQTLRAKEEDLRVYSSTLEETKKVFLQALRQMKDRQANS